LLKKRLYKGGYPGEKQGITSRRLKLKRSLIMMKSLLWAALAGVMLVSPALAKDKMAGHSTMGTNGNACMMPNGMGTCTLNSDGSMSLMSKDGKSMMMEDKMGHMRMMDKAGHMSMVDANGNMKMMDGMSMPEGKMMMMRMKMMDKKKGSM
jgi:hypothetical protein